MAASINQAEESWPDTLQGRPRKAYEFWLQPLGYKLKVLIVDWPNGLPGDVCISPEMTRALAPIESKRLHA